MNPLGKTPNSAAPERLTFDDLVHGLREILTRLIRIDAQNQVILERLNALAADQEDVAILNDALDGAMPGRDHHRP